MSWNQNLRLMGYETTNPRLDLTGQRFHNWTVLQEHHNKHRPHGYNVTSWQPQLWLVLCDCGRHGTINTDVLQGNNRKYCTNCAAENAKQKQWSKRCQN